MHSQFKMGKNVFPIQRYFNDFDALPLSLKIPTRKLSVPFHIKKKHSRIRRRKKRIYIHLKDFVERRKYQHNCIVYTNILCGCFVTCNKKCQKSMLTSCPYIQYQQFVVFRSFFKSQIPDVVNNC